MRQFEGLYNESGFCNPIARSGPSSHPMALTNDNDMFLEFGLQGLASSLRCCASEVGITSETQTVQVRNSWLFGLWVLVVVVQ